MPVPTTAPIVSEAPSNAPSARWSVRGSWAGVVGSAGAGTLSLGTIAAM